MNLDKISFKLPTVKFEKKINEKKNRLRLDILTV